MLTMRLRRSFLYLLVTGLLVVGFAWLNNNSSLRPLLRAKFLRELDDAVTTSRDWVLDVGEGASVFGKEEGAALMTNAALLHMVADCARSSGDQRLQSLATRYFRVVSTPYWFGRLVDPSCRFERPPESYLRSIDDYQRWFLHAVAPREYQLSTEDRVDMFSPDKYRTGSATHQLFALYLYRNHNGTTPDLDRLIGHISARIASEASIDFRVTDLYLQRIAFLLAAGQPDLIKRRWVERVFAAQQTDGGWLWSWYGWHPKPFRFRLAEVSFSTSHPTVQGMWIAYMLKYRYRQWVEKNYQ
jgi:hypothetical protein